MTATWAILSVQVEEEDENIRLVCEEGRRFWGVRTPVPVVFSYVFVVSVFLFPVPPRRTTFSVDPDTHIDSIEQAEEMTIEGTSKWSCKIAITGIGSCILLGAGSSNTLKYRMPFQLTYTTYLQWYMTTISEHLSALFLFECVSLSATSFSALLVMGDWGRGSRQVSERLSLVTSSLSLTVLSFRN